MEEQQLEHTPEKTIIAARRIGAAILDGLMIGIVGFIVTWAFRDEFVALGPNARWLGLPILLAYFGVMNSEIAGGQTLAKRMLGIRVVGYDGNPIPLKKSLLRAVMLDAPIIMNGAIYTASFGAYAYSILASYAVFLVLLANCYLFVLNRVTRQGLHDLLVKTLVVRCGTDAASLPDAASLDRVRGISFKIVAVHAALLTVGIAWFFNWVTAPSQQQMFEELTALQHDLTARSEVTYAQVRVNADHPNDSRESFVSIALFLSAPEHLNDNYALEVTCSASAAHDWMGQKTVIALQLIYGYDIGIWSASRSNAYTISPARLFCGTPEPANREQDAPDV